MPALVDLVVSCVPAPLMAAVVFAIGYVLVGIPVHFRRGAVARDVLGTLAGVFCALIYIAFVVGVHSGVHTASR